MMLQSMIGMMMITILVGCAILIMAKQYTKQYNINDKYSIFKIEQQKLKIFSGIPASYDLDKIEKVTFSYVQGRRQNYMGIMRIVKTNGAKSRPFMFDSSVSKKVMVLTTSKTGIERTIQYLMDELERCNISCKFYTDGENSN